MGDSESPRKPEEFTKFDDYVLDRLGPEGAERIRARAEELAATRLLKVFTDQKCHCGTTLEIEVAESGNQKGVGWANFSRDAGNHSFALRCVCQGCGAVFDPDHRRFVAYYNMAADRII